ncbi:MAG: type III secretion system chaperone [Ideonella sp.]|nr:type III secretion system chaperone [Ideonella sp.]
MGLPAFEPDAAGGIALTVGSKTKVFVFGQSDGFLLLAVPAVALPKEPDYATMQWLLHRNFYDSDLAPFRIATDAGGTILLWGRVPVEGMTGAALAGLVDAVASEAHRIRDEVDG